MQTSADSKGTKRHESEHNKLKLQWEISDERIALWLSRADLARITGQGGIYLPLLDHVGIETVPELALSDPSNLMAAMQNFKPGARTSLLLPDQSQVANWIAQARIMVTREY